MRRHRVLISAAAHDALAARMPAGWILGGCEPVGFGGFFVDLDEDVYQRLLAVADDPSDAILRVCSGQFGSA